MLKSSDLDISVIISKGLSELKKFHAYIMKVTVKEGWSDTSKLAVIAIIGSLLAITLVVIFD
ncbi:MAG: hypothetical protein OEL81_08615 [Nitrosopumilus sp.]|nr:hypothetical protein [Nitrosopumilus sp.]